MTRSTPCQIIAETVGQLYACTEVNGFVRIRTPYLYPDGDVIDLFLKESSQTLTDLGETLRWLDMQSFGKDLSKKQKSLLEDIQLTYGIELHREMLLVRVQDNLADALTRLAEAVMAVSNLWFLNRTRLISGLNDEIAELLDEHQIDYEREVKLLGRSNQAWEIDFRTQHQQRSTLIEVLSTGSRSAAKNKVNAAVAAWLDLSHYLLGQEPLKFISLFDDSVDIWTDGHMSQLAEFSEICYISQPEELLAHLVN